MVDWHTLTVEKTLKKLKTGKNGLSNKKVGNRKRKYGKNTIKVERDVSPFRIFISQFTSLLIVILILAALVLLELGMTVDPGKFIDAVLILAIVIANGVFGFVQDYKAEKNIQALRRMSAPKALIRREGKPVKIPSSEIVPGDILIIEEGTRIPADARLIKSVSMEVNEAILTGESIPVEKKTATLKDKISLAERSNMVFMNTIVARGRGEAVVVATGRKTEVGKIASQLQKIKSEPSKFQEEMNVLGKRIGLGIILLILSMAGVLFVLQIMDTIQIFVTSIALAVAAIPEGLPAVVTLSLALGSRKMLSKKTLVRKLPVVESLGSVNVIVADKTGTMTENQMTVREIWTQGKKIRVTGSGYETEGKFQMDNKAKKKDVKPLIRAGVLCNNAMAEKGFYGDPTEIALLISGLKLGFRRENLEKKYPRVDEIPFSSERKKMTTVHKKRTAFMKGAPEVVLEDCNRILMGGRVRKLSKKKKEEILKINKKMAGRALRVLGFAYRKDLKGKKSQKNVEKKMIFLGLQGMMDPPRKEVKGAIKTARKAGIRVIMATGDNAMTARAIAEELGIKGEVTEGKEIEDLSDKELGKVMEATAVFARVDPHHKVKLLKALQKKDYIVAMTGDGVNDAPSLEKANVGIAMGEKGTDVAKETSDMVLLDDNFKTIVEAVKEGRTIFENIRKFVNYLLTCNLAEVLVVFLMSLFGYLPITAVMLLWINLLTDGLPALALGSDPPPPGIMSRDPRPSEEGVINRRLAYLIGGIGLEMTVLIIAVFLVGLQYGMVVAQTMAFTGFVLFELVRIGVIRYQEHLRMLSNRWLIGAIGTSFLLQLVVLYSPFNSFFGVVPLGTEPWLILILVTAVGWIAAVMMTRFVSRITRTTANPVSGS